MILDKLFLTLLLLQLLYLKYFATVHGAAEDPFFRLPNLRTSHPLTARLSADAIHSFRDSNPFEPPALKYPFIHARIMVSFAISGSRLLLPAATCCLGYTRSNLTLFSPPRVSKSRMLISICLTGKTQEVKPHAPRAPKGARHVLHSYSLLSSASTESNSPNIAGTPCNHIRLSLLQPRELGHRQTRQEAGLG
jgi:hypothetical protein